MGVEQQQQQQEAMSNRKNSSKIVEEKNGVQVGLERSSSSSPREKAQQLWSNVRNQLVEFSALPEYLRDNNYILNYYRVDYPFKRALLSIFHIHNETLNVWTYALIPLLKF